MKLNRAHKGQSLMEYTILFIIVLGSFVAMSSYLKRGIQGRWKESVDSFGEQYDPSNMVSNVRYSLDANTVTLISTQNDAVMGGFWTNRVDLSNSVETKTGQMQVQGY